MVEHDENNTVAVTNQKTTGSAEEFVEVVQSAAQSVSLSTQIGGSKNIY